MSEVSVEGDGPHGPLEEEAPSCDGCCDICECPREGAEPEPPVVLTSHFLLGWRARLEILWSGEVRTVVTVRPDGAALEARLDTGRAAR